MRVDLWRRRVPQEKQPEHVCSKPKTLERHTVQAQGAWGAACCEKECLCHQPGWKGMGKCPGAPLAVWSRDCTRGEVRACVAAPGFIWAMLFQKNDTMFCCAQGKGISAETATPPSNSTCSLFTNNPQEAQQQKAETKQGKRQLKWCW